jgi:hypothetical protein
MTETRYCGLEQRLGKWVAILRITTYGEQIAFDELSLIHRIHVLKENGESVVETECALFDLQQKTNP